jgi:hypothetical protein
MLDKLIDEVARRPLLSLVTVCLCAALFLCALGVGIGLAIAISNARIAGSSAYAAWVVLFGTVACVLIGASLTCLAVVVLFKQARTKPLAFATVALSLVSVVLVGVVREFELKDMPVIGLLLQGVTLVSVSVGAVLLDRDGFAIKSVGFLFPLFPAGLLVFCIVLRSGSPFWTALQEVTLGTWIVVVGFLLISTLLGILANKLSRSI